jgi:hypothetical protein
MRRCRCCERPQCPNADDGRHLWVPQAGLKYQCADCDAEIPMQLASLQGGVDRDAGPPPPPAAWVGLRQLDRAVEVLDLGEHGLLFRVGDDPCVPIWLPARARNPRPLTDGAVDRWYADQLAADLIRKAKKAWDPMRQESLFGGQGGVSDVVELRRRATARAVATGVASWR